VLAIVSQLPYHVRIFSVDHNLCVRCLFNSYGPNPASLHRVHVGIGPLYEIKIAKPGVFLLYEGAEAGWPDTLGGPHGFHGRYPYSRHVRVFTVRFPHGHFRIRPSRRHRTAMS
jgi:hypothetical protein